MAVLEQLASGAEGSQSTQATFEILHTDALLRLADHLSFGKVDATSFDAQWNYTRSAAGINVSQKLESAVASADLYADIEKLKPTHRLYRTLKQELAHFRELGNALIHRIVLCKQHVQRALASSQRVLRNHSFCLNALQNFLHRTEKFMGNHGFEQIGINPEVLAPPGIVPLSPRRQNQDWKVRAIRLLPNALYQFKAIHFWHRDISD
jgi:hypothetical protein